MAKSKLTKAEVKHIARLAQIKLSEAKVKKFALQLTETLDYVKSLHQLDTKGVEPTSQVTGLENVTREDKTTPSLTPEEALSGAASQENNLFKIKAIF